MYPIFTVSVKGNHTFALSNGVYVSPGSPVSIKKQEIIDNKSLKNCLANGVRDNFIEVKIGDIALTVDDILNIGDYGEAEIGKWTLCGKETLDNASEVTVTIPNPGNAEYVVVPSATQNVNAYATITDSTHFVIHLSAPMTGDVHWIVAFR